MIIRAEGGGSVHQVISGSEIIRDPSQDRVSEVLPRRSELYGVPFAKRMAALFASSSAHRAKDVGCVGSSEELPSRRSVHGGRALPKNSAQSKPRQGVDIVSSTLPSSHVLPRRQDLHRKSRRLFRSLGYYLTLFKDKFNISGHDDRAAARRSTLFDYVPAGLFVGMSLATLGLFPYVWVWCNLYAFAALCGKQVGTARLRLFAVTGFCVQLLLPALASVFFWNGVTQQPSDYDGAASFMVLFAVLYIVVIFPQRCSLYLIFGNSLRRLADSWDREGLMVSRTINSSPKLILLGSSYIQYHINRLADLGAPGLVSESEMMGDLSFLEFATGCERRPRRVRGYNRYHY